MRQRSVGPGEVLRVSQHRINSAELLKLLPPVGQIAGGVGAHGIVVADGNHERLRCEGIEEIPTIETDRTGTNEVLFGVVYRTRWIEIRTGDIFGVTAANHRSGKTVVNRH